MTEALELTFSNVKIGIKDCNNIDLFNGDIIEIKVAKNVIHKGEIIYENGAFSIKVKRNGSGLFMVTPLCNYASYCKITKLN